MNAFTAVIRSMSADGYSDQQIADHLEIPLTEVTDALNAHQHHQSTKAEPKTETSEEGVSAGKEEDLLAWGEQHETPVVRRHAKKARESLAALRQRHALDAELEEIRAEASELEKRLAALRQREAQMRPRTKTRTPDHSPREVRAWARSAGIDIPDRGAIPHTVLNAWKARHAPLRSVS